MVGRGFCIATLVSSSSPLRADVSRTLQPLFSHILSLSLHRFYYEHMSIAASPKTDLPIYQTKDGTVKLSVKLTDDTVWLSQADIAALFSVQVPAVSKHVKNIYKDGELKPKETLSKMETVRKEGKKTVTRTIDAFNLDMVLSIGYRVNSRRATQFRVWASQVLKQHLLKGYSLNSGRLEHSKWSELKEAVGLIKKAMERKQLTGDESQGLLKVITDYAQTWLLLDQFDRAQLPPPRDEHHSRYRLTHDDVEPIVRALKKDLVRRKQADERFGTEKGETLKEILSKINLATDRGVSTEKNAAHLLYALIQQQPFEDGNKRIAAFLFIVYLTRTQVVSSWDGERKFSDHALVALVLLIAESDPKQKELLLNLVMNFVHG